MWRVIWFFLGVSRLSITGASPEWCMQRLAKARAGGTRILFGHDGKQWTTIRENAEFN